MATLPDLPESQQESLQKHADAMLNAMERGQSAPWLKPNGELDHGLIALVARGVQTLPQDDQDLFFHRMGEVLAQSGTVRDRRVGNLLYQSTQLLNAAGHAIAHPKVDAERDARLAEVPSDLLADTREILAWSLVQHAREIPDDAHSLAQDALILYARDAGKGWGLSNADLADAVVQTQGYYFNHTELPEKSRNDRFDVLRDADLDMATLQDFVVEARYRTRFQIPDTAQPENDAAPESQATSASESRNETAGETPQGNADSTDPSGAADAEVSPVDPGARTDDAQNAKPEAPKDADKSVSDSAHGEDEPPPYPDELMDASFSEAEVAVFNDEVLVSPVVKGIQDDEANARGDWPAGDALSGSKKKTSRQRAQAAHDSQADAILQGFPTQGLQGSPFPPQNPAYGAPYPGNGALGNGGNNGGNLVMRGPGLFAGLGNMASGLGAMAANIGRKPQASGHVPLHEQMQEIHGRRAEQRDEKRQQATAEKKYRSADRFLGRLNERIDLFKTQEPVQEMLRRVHQDLENRAQFVRDGVSDAKTQEQRHKEWSSHEWERFFAKNPKLQSALSKLESDAEQIPEMVNPALASTDQLNRDPRAEREALLAKVDRAQANSQGLPASVPGKKNLADIMGGVIGAIKRFLSRLLGGSEVVIATPHAAVSAMPDTVAPSIQRRAGP